MPVIGDSRTELKSVIYATDFLFAPGTPASTPRAWPLFLGKLLVTHAFTLNKPRWKLKSVTDIKPAETELDASSSERPTLWEQVHSRSPTLWKEIRKM